MRIAARAFQKVAIAFIRLDTPEPRRVHKMRPVEQSSVVQA